MATIKQKAVFAAYAEMQDKQAAKKNKKLKMNKIKLSNKRKAKY